MQLKQHIPNLVTLLNLLSGCFAIVFTLNDDFILAAIFVIAGIFFDFFDGLIARLLKAQSPLGIQLDSLADLVTSGVVPGLIIYKLLNLAVDATFTVGSWQTSNSLLPTEGSYLPFFGFLIPLASAYRLAKFNIDEDQQSYFKGLPVPANTLLILSLPLILEFQQNDIMNNIIINKWFLIALTLVSCYLLNSSHRLFALKFKNWSFKNNALRYIFISLSIVFLIVLKFAAIPVVIILYILLSILFFKVDEGKIL